MKLSKNNKHFLSMTFKDKNKKNLYSDSKAASICCYNSNLVLNLSKQDLQYFNIDLDKIQSFFDIKFLFLNEEYKKILLNKTVIRSENPFITSMLTLNKISKLKYFIELICLNKVEINPEFDFLKPFFEELHRENFVYLYYTNKLNDFADIKFTLQVDSFYQKSFEISRLQNEGSLEIKNENFSEEINYFEKYEQTTEKKISRNNTTIKEVSEDEKNLNADNGSQISKKNIIKESLCKIESGDKNNYTINNNIKLKNIQCNENVISKTISFKIDDDLKISINFDKNNESGSEIYKPSLTEDNRKSNNLLINKTKNENQNFSSAIYDKKNTTSSKNEILSNDNIYLLNENIFGDLVSNKSQNYFEKKENNEDNKSLQNENNLNLNVEEQLEDHKYHEIQIQNFNNKSALKVDAHKENEIQEEKLDNKEKKDHSEITEQIEKEDLSIKNNKENNIKSVFLTGNEIEVNKNYFENSSNNKSENKKITNEINNEKIITSNHEKILTNEELEAKTDKDGRSNFVEKENSKIINTSNINPQNENEKLCLINNELKTNSNQDHLRENKIDSQDNDFLLENESNKNSKILNSNGKLFKKRLDYPKDSLLGINFNLGNYQFLYIDMDFTVKKQMRNIMEKLCSFVEWVWENFRYMKFIIYMPKLQDFYLNLNQDIFNKLNGIFSIADFLLFEKKDLLEYKKVFKDLLEINNNLTSTSELKSFQDTSKCQGSFRNPKIMNLYKKKGRNIKCEQQMQSNWEEFFLHQFGIKKRTVPLTVYPTKTLIIIDDLNKITIFEKNYENRIIFKSENEFVLYPQNINHTNQNIIELYKNCLNENYFELRGIFFGAFLSKIMQKPIKVDTILSRDYTGGYMISIEISKKFLKVFYNEQPFPNNNDFYKINLDKNLANSKLAEDVHRRRESKFVLDCINEKKSYLKNYDPLNDNYLKDFFNIRSVSNTMRNLGFVKSRGKIIEPKKDEKSKIKESLKIGGKFYIRTSPNKLNDENFGFHFSRNNNNIDNNFLFSTYRNSNLFSSIENKYNTENKEKMFSTKYKLLNLSIKKNNLENQDNNFDRNDSETCTFLQKPNSVATVFSKKTIQNLPKLNSNYVKLDPEEQIKDYIQFEKNLLI